MATSNRRIGIIPAAGRAERFGGTMKELLPIDQHKCMMDYSIMAMERGRCEPIVCVTCPRKIAQLSEVRPRLLYTIQTATRDIWGAIHAGLMIEADEYCFAMPDTAIPEDAFDRDLESNFMLGCFETNMPERFGMVREGAIVNKMAGEPGLAWGVLMWSKQTRDYWLEYDHDILNYTHAFNMAMGVYMEKIFMLDGYVDISCFADYKGLIGG